MQLPLFLKTDHLPCLVIGGGKVGAHKIEILLGLGCTLTVIAPTVEESIRDLESRGRIRWLSRRFQPGDCAGFHLVIAATHCSETNRAVSSEATSMGIPVNVVDVPDLCTVTFGAFWNEAPLTIAVSTGGTAPFMAAEIRDRVSDVFRGFGRWVEAASRFRSAVRREIRDPEERNILYRRFKACAGNGVPADPPDARDLADWLAYLSDVESKR